MSPGVSKNSFESKLVKFANLRGRSKEHVERTVANVVLAQIIQMADPDATSQNFVKGGTGVLLRLGLSNGRATGDLDMSMGLDRAGISDLVTALEGITWGDFHVATVKELRAKTKTKVAEEYRLKEFRVPLIYGASDWRTVRLEIARHELSLPDIPVEEFMDNEIIELFETLGLPQPRPIRLMPVELQIAQKLHAMTETESERGHDLFDVHSLVVENEPDIAKLANAVARTFTYRGTHPWTSNLATTPKFQEIYEIEVVDIANAPTFEEALATVLNLMAQIDPYLTERK